MASGKSLSEDFQSWQPLRLFNIYRLFVATLFLALWGFDLAPKPLGHIAPELFYHTLIGYLIAGVVAIPLTYLRWPSFRFLTSTLTTVDITAVILLAHCSGGVNSGVEVLLIPAIGAAGLLLSELSALFAAAGASFLLLLDQIYLHLSGLQENAGYTKSGLLGLALFVTAIVSTALAHRARINEALAVRRGLDLANLAELNEYIVGHFNSGLIVIEPHGEIRLINDAAWQLISQPYTNPAKSIEDFSPGLLLLFRQWQTNPDAQPRTLPLPGKGIELRVRFTSLGLNQQATLITLEDQAEITAQVQSAKLASLGRLAASIAHEIRNPLSAISHSSQLLSESPSLEAQDLRLVDIIHSQGKRIDAIIGDVLRLSRKDPPNIRPIKLQPWLETRTDEILNHGTIENVDLEPQLDGTELTTICDEGHLTQIFWALCENASRYGRNETGGKLELIVAVHRPPGTQHIRLDVIDNGPGVPTEIAPHLFEPFFTTSNTGTGLGLYIASELCALNSGRLEYLQMPSGGSCFRCFLPAPKRTKMAH